MTILGIGTDIVSIDRIKQVPDFDRFSEYVLIPNEIQLMNDSRDRVQFLASRFAAKEAVIKSYPTNITYQDIETFKDGEKFAVRIIKTDAPEYTVNASVSHSFDTAIAIASVSI